MWQELYHCKYCIRRSPIYYPGGEIMNGIPNYEQTQQAQEAFNKKIERVTIKAYGQSATIVYTREDGMAVFIADAFKEIKCNWEDKYYILIQSIEAENGSHMLELVDDVIDAIKARAERLQNRILVTLTESSGIETFTAKGFIPLFDTIPLYYWIPPEPPDEED
jgi:hypothetical protein